MNKKNTKLVLDGMVPKPRKRNKILSVDEELYLQNLHNPITPVYVSKISPSNKKI